MIALGSTGFGGFDPTLPNFRLMFADIVLLVRSQRE